ncbi:MAG: restriction endonuclease subunit M, partial [Flavobacteriales bacterium CG_4_10_14_0_8_um_filter_32_5]
GVDINEESVEIAQLSLWLRTARKDRKLSSLNNNIKCGNSLLTENFDWHKEFPDIMKNGGFDAVIGNPPYIKEYTNRQAFDGLHAHYCYQGKMDLWYFFGA